MLRTGAAAKIGKTGRESGLKDGMPERLMIRERPPHSDVVTKPDR